MHLHLWVHRRGYLEFETENQEFKSKRKVRGQNLKFRSTANSLLRPPSVCLAAVTLNHSESNSLKAKLTVWEENQKFESKTKSSKSKSKASQQNQKFASTNIRVPRSGHPLPFLVQQSQINTKCVKWKPEVWKQTKTFETKTISPFPHNSRNLRVPLTQTDTPICFGTASTKHFYWAVIYTISRNQASPVSWGTNTKSLKP